MGSFWRGVLSEPLIPFALVGGVIFLVSGFQQSKPEKDTIEIRRSTVVALERAQEELLGRSLTDEEKDEILEGYLEEEVLLREAFRLQLEKQDTRVRKRLLDVMRSTLDQPVAQPSQAELRQYYEQNLERYTSRDLITFEQVFFSFGSANEPEDPMEFLALLRDGADFQQLGDNLLFGHTVRDRPIDQLRLSLGVDFSKQLSSLPLDEWKGPIVSKQGIHFVRVTGRQDAATPEFEKLEEYLRQDWMFRKRRELQSEKIEKLREQFRVLIEPEE